MTDCTTQINKFWNLVYSGKSAALDVNKKTNEMIVRATKSTSGVEGNGTPPSTYGADWMRVMVSNKGVITQS